MPAKQSGVKLTPHQVARIKEMAEARPGGGVTFSQVIREAVDLWLDEAPQALDVGELAFLRASRELRKGNPAIWAAAMRGFAAMVGEVNPELEGTLNEIVAVVSNDPAARTGDGVREKVQPSKTRKAS